MQPRKEYIRPDLRIVGVRFEYSLLQSGTDRADEGYDPGNDLGEIS